MQRNKQNDYYFSSLASLRSSGIASVCTLVGLSIWARVEWKEQRTLTVFSRMPHDCSWFWSKPHIIQGLNFYEVWDKGWCARDNVFGHIGHNHRRPLIITIFLAPAHFVLEARPIRFKAVQGLGRKSDRMNVQPFTGIANPIPRPKKMNAETLNASY